MNRLMGLLLLVVATGLCAGERGAPIADYPAQQIAPNSYLIEGPLGTPSVANQGFMNNPAFILTPAGVVVIDPGASVQIGEMVLRQIAKVTDQPVVAVFNTHIHGDHWLGNQAIREQYPQAVIYGHPKMLARVAAGEGDTWLNTMDRLTEGATRGTQVVGPEKPLDHGDEVIVGGVRFQFLYIAEAHSDTDLMIAIPAEDLLFHGDNVMSQRFGQMTHGTFKGNIAAINLALTTPMTQHVPGHGPLGDRDMVVAYRTYLETIRNQVTELMDEGLSDFEMKPKIIDALKPYHGWVGFEEEIGRHINKAFLEVEREQF